VYLIRVHIAEEREQKMPVIEIEIPEKILAGTLCNAWEGGSNYWARQEDGKGSPYTWKSLKDGLKLVPCFSVTITDIETDKKYVFTYRHLLRGAKVMAEKYPRHFGDMLSEVNADAITGDVLLQCSIFGEIVYG
jgi:hypothetical protein